MVRMGRSLTPVLGVHRLVQLGLGANMLQVWLIYPQWLVTTYHHVCHQTRLIQQNKHFQLFPLLYPPSLATAYHQP